MTQAVNLANFANNLDSSGGVNPSALNAAVPVSKGGTGGTTQATAQSGLNVPSTTGTGASGTWGIGISGNAATATTATSTPILQTTDYTIQESSGNLIIKNGTTQIGSIDSAGNHTAATTKIGTAGVTFPDATVQGTSFWAGIKAQLFNTVGSGYTFTIPTGVTAIKVTLAGGGGGGGAGLSGACPYNGGTGGFGGNAVQYFTGLTAGNTLTITVGAAGVGVASSNGTSGGATSVASGTQTITTVSCTGGGGGNTVGVQGSNGSASGQLLTFYQTSRPMPNGYSVGGTGGNGPTGGTGGNGSQGFVLIEW